MLNRNHKLIIFDLGGTVFTKGKHAFIVLLAMRTNFSAEKIKTIIDGPDSLAYRCGKISEQDYWQKVIRLLNINLTMNDLKFLWFEQYKPIAGMPELIKRLKRNYKIICLSNNFPERVSYLQKKYNFLNWFDDGIFSYETQALKADHRTAEYILNKFQPVSAHKIIIVDDNSNNLVKLSEFGFITNLFVNITQLKQDLKKIGVLASR